MPLIVPDALAPVLKSRYPHRPRALFLLRQQPDASAESFRDALRDWRRQRAFEVGPGSIVARAGAAMVEEQELISGRFRRRGVEVTPVDGYVSLDIESYEPTADDFETLLGEADGCLDSLVDVIDPAGSIALAGVANLVIPGVAPLSMILILDRAEGISLEQYNEWWVRHGDDHRRANPAQVGYHQVHIAPELNVRAAEAAGVSTTEHCVIDFMCLGRLQDAFSAGGEQSRDDARALAADIAAHVSFATVTGSLMHEL